MAEQKKRYVIVGGVAGGATAAARLRRLDETGEIILLERGDYVSYANCGLPYYIGGSIKNRSALLVQSKESIAAKFALDIRTGAEVTAIDRANKCLSVRNKKLAENEPGAVYELSYDKLLLATGSTPFVPPLDGMEKDGKRLDSVFTLWTIPDTDAIDTYIREKSPRRAVVVGGGFIGIEMAENLVERGLSVSILEMADHLLPPLDTDMARLVENHLREKGVRLFLGKGIAGFSDDGKNVLVKDGSAIPSDLTLLSIGVRANSALARAAGLELNARGGIVTDEWMRTSDPDIYAVGDVTEIPDALTGSKTMIPLAGPANRQGRLVAASLSGKEQREAYTGALGSSVAKVFDLTMATTGWNEKRLARENYKLWEDYGIMLTHPSSHAGYYPGATAMTLKLIFALKDLGGNIRKHQALGAQIVGYEGVDKRIDTIAATLHFHGTIYDLAGLELAYAPPYSSAKDPVNLAAYAACNLVEGLTEAVTAEAYEADKKAYQLLDIREQPETIAGIPDQAQHIPLSELRTRLDELKPGTPYLLVCAVGLRGYIGARILRQRGFSAKYLLGGLRSLDDAREAARAEKDPEGGLSPLSSAGKTPQAVLKEAKADTSSFASSDPASASPAPSHEPVRLDLCGLSCPGPIMSLASAMKDLNEGEQLEALATDPGFARDIGAWCESTGNCLVALSKEKGETRALLQKGKGQVPTLTRDAAVCPREALPAQEKTMIVFSGDLDKAIAAFIIANGAAAMGDRVNLFFTFWGLSILRKREKAAVSKDFMSRMFSMMLPRGSRGLPLSKMNFLGAGPKMIRSVMQRKKISSLEHLIEEAKKAGVRMTACQMSMDVMGISKEELMDGVEVGGVASMLNDNNRSNMNLFIS